MSCNFEAGLCGWRMSHLDHNSELKKGDFEIVTLEFYHVPVRLFQVPGEFGKNML